MTGRKIKKIGATLLGVLILVYVLYQAVISKNNDIKIETTVYSSLSDTVETTSFMVRKEILVDEEYSGVLNYNVADGERVANGGVIANVYSNESDAMVQGKINALDMELKELSSLLNPGEYSTMDADSVGTQIGSSISDIEVNSRNGNFANVYERKYTLQTLLNLRKVVLGEESVENYEQKINELKAERDALESSAGEKTGEILSPAAGYFISEADGFEDKVEYEYAKAITPKRLGELLESEPEYKTDALGKICSEFRWYAVCMFSSDDVVRLEGVTSVTLEMPFATADKVPAQVVAINSDEELGQSAVVFECTNMNSDIAIARREPVQVVIGTYSGLLVNEKAIRYIDVETEEEDENGNPMRVLHKDTKGVFIRYGTTVKFLQIFSEKTVNGYAVCKTEAQLSDEERESLVTDATVQLYDEVIVEGTDLYDGKLL